MKNIYIHYSYKISFFLTYFAFLLLSFIKLWNIFFTFLSLTTIKFYENHLNILIVQIWFIPGLLSHFTFSLLSFIKFWNVFFTFLSITTLKYDEKYIHYSYKFAFFSSFFFNNLHLHLFPSLLIKYILHILTYNNLETWWKLPI